MAGLGTHGSSIRNEQVTNDQDQAGGHAGWRVWKGSGSFTGPFQSDSEQARDATAAVTCRDGLEHRGEATSNPMPYLTAESG